MESSKDMILEKPENLYHYCSVQTFYNIMKNKSIWLSDISKSNDSQELRYFIDAFESLITTIWNSLIRERAENGYSDNPIEVQSLLSNIIQALRSEAVKCWAFCLSGKRDDLGQWRGYADNGAGVAIGFKTIPFFAVNFEQEIDPRAKNNMLYSPRFDKVYYGDLGLSRLETKFRDGLELSPGMSPIEIQKRLINGIIPAFMAAPFFKNDGFSEEDEWRLVYILESSKISLEIIPRCEVLPIAECIGVFHPAEWGYVGKGKDLVSHVAFSNTHFEESISEIIIGPKCDLSVLEVKLFLVSCGFFHDVDACTVLISKSASSFR